MSRFRLALLAPAVLALLAAHPAAPPANDFQFAILGDRTGLGSSQVYERVWKEVGRLHPDFVINVGDTIQGLNDSLAAAEWEDLHRLWRTARYPLYFTPGNHDIWNDFSRRLYERQTGRPSFYGFNFQNAHFTVLDNSTSVELSDQQLRFLEDDLKANRDRAPKFVFFHKPFWILPLKLGSGEFPLHRLARQYGVNYVVCGHIHQLIRIERDGIVYLDVGSSGGSMERGTSRGQGFAQGWFYQYVWVAVKGAHAQLQVAELGGKMHPIEEW